MNAIFTHNSLTIDGQCNPAEYSITPSGAVCIFVTVEEQGQPCRLKITQRPGDEYHAAALEAAQEYRRIWNLEREESAEAPTLLSTIEQDMAIALAPLALPEPAAEPEAVEPLEADEISDSAAAERPESIPEKRRADVPEKFFIGMEIKGRGWRIEFNGSYERTRVIFKKKPSDRALEAVKRHGFYWSPVMKSWNKKLTHKAWRAAQALAMELRTICA